MPKSLFSLIICIFCYKSKAQDIIPNPNKYTVFEGTTIVDQHTIIKGWISEQEVLRKKASLTMHEPILLDLTARDTKSYAMIQLFKEKLIQEDIKFANKASKYTKSIISILENRGIKKEGYTITINKKQINIACSDLGGLHNALQSLLQLIQNAKKEKGNVILQNAFIEDEPRFSWRGLMLDVSRHFFNVDEVKNYIDLMSRYKFNVLHWHLTDDEGWRIEIKSLPKLTEVGAWRVERNGRFGEGRPYPKEGEKATYGGFYTQEQIKDIIKYAQLRNVEIVPEIDIPGHSMAALAAYPELSTGKDVKFVNPGSKFSEWYGDGTFKMLIENTLNPADSNVYVFVDKVMTEVAALFPSKYIHMGGDECYHGYWEKDIKVQAFMKVKSIKDMHGLQSYFVTEVNKIVNKKGKNMIGWDEILEGGLSPNAAVMSWRGIKGGIEAAKKGHSVVMSPTTYAYLDYTQGDKSVENPIYADLSLKKTYSFNPVPEGIEEKYVLGTQGNLWTEVIPSLPFAYYMTYPRALAIAENAWTYDSKKDYAHFLKRTEKAFTWFDDKDLAMAKTIYEPEISLKKTEKGIELSLSSDLEDVEIFYSTDNTYPVKFSKKYSGPFLLPNGDYKLRTQVYRKNKALGRELIIPQTELEKRVK
jgi:hexosaminidase